MTKQTLRTFMAVQLSPEVKSCLTQNIHLLKASLTVPIRWVSTEKMHLTLRFLGDVKVAQMPEIIEALQPLKALSSFEMTFESFMGLPSSHTRVIALGVKASEKLLHVVEHIENAIEPIGIPKEYRRFMPHITLGRVRNPRKTLHFPSAIIPPQQFVSEITLYESQPAEEGNCYVPLCQFPLRKL